MKNIISPGFNSFSDTFYNHILHINFKYSKNMSYKRKGEAPEKKY